MEVINHRDVDVKNGNIEYYLNEIRYVLDNENVFITKKEFKESGCIGGESLRTFVTDIDYRISYRGLLKVEESDLDDDDELIVGDVFESDEWSEWLFTINTVTYSTHSTNYIITHNGNVRITEDEKNLLIKELLR